MGSGDLFKHLFKSLNLEKYISGVGNDARVQLTPLIALIASIIYMMIADGEVSDSESSQLQSVIGDNDEALHRALRYVESTPQEEFLKELPSVVFGNDKLCILLNVCDSIMSDGVLSSLEWDLFQNLLAALGHTEKSFKPYFGAIAIKNKRSVLGSFNDNFSADNLTPQLSLAVALLYMMSSDGVMAKEELGQLQVIVGESKSLLKSALQYVGKNKALQFLKDVPTILTQRQKLCILINACDTMLSDGLVENAERELFKRMLPAFGYTEDSFKAYYQIIFLKNEKPLDRRPVTKKTKEEIPAAIQKTEEESVIFDRKFLVETEKSSNEDFKKVDHSTKLKDGKSTIEKNSLESSISSRMRENAENLSKAIEGEQGLETIAKNANQANEGTPKDSSKPNSGPIINHKLKEESLNSASSNQKQSQSEGPVLEKNIKDNDSGPKVKNHVIDSDNGPSISNKISDLDGGPKTQSRIDDLDGGPKLQSRIDDLDGGPKTQNRINDLDGGPQTQSRIDDLDGGPKLQSRNDDLDGGPKTQNRIDDLDGGPQTQNRINDSDGGPEINRHSADDGISVDGKHLRDEKANFEKSSINDGEGPVDYRKSKDADHLGNHKPSGNSGPEIPRLQRDSDQLIDPEATLGPNDGPIIRNELQDDSGATAGPQQERMVFAKGRTEKIHGYLDQLEKYDLNKPNPKGVDMSSIYIKPPAITPKPPAATQSTAATQSAAGTQAVAPAQPVAAVPITTAVVPAANSPELIKTREVAISKTEPMTETVPLTNSHTRLMAGILFTALSATHGISSLGESQAQVEMVSHGYQAVQIQSAFQSVSAQQVNYQLAANELDLSLDDTNKLSPEQKEIAQSRLVLYQTTIQNKETSPTSMDGKKELASSIKQQDELARQASSRMNSFVFAKAILLFGIGLSFMAFFSRSRWVLYGSGVAAVLGMAMTANGFFMFI